ncbi:MAG: hypothetical protein HZC37_03925 [Burkholderiales bacterium]|nr:hypothetical protein [Burkholderiales bacterium]
MELKVRITMTDELTEELVHSSGLLDLASGEISRVEYENYDLAALGHPWDADDYEFTSGTLSHDGKDVEFKVDVNKTTGQRSVSANELLEIKVRAAALFAGMSGKDLLGSAEAGRAPGGGKTPPRRGPGPLH